MISTLSKLLLIGIPVLAIAAHAFFLLFTRRPVMAQVVDSSLPDATRYSHHRMQTSKLGDFLALADDNPMESVNLRLRYDVDGRRYFKDVSTFVRKGERAEQTQMLWYDPSDPSRATDKDVSWIGLGLGVVTLFAVALKVI